MTKATHIDHAGKKLEEITLSESLFAAKVSPALLAQAVRIYQDRQHQHTSKTKGRGEINMTTAKWFKQKGTGRARHGAQSAPIFVGGGVAHGPNGVRAAGKILPLKMRRLSIVGALTNKAQNQKVTIISGLDQMTNKTSQLSKLLKELKFTNKVLLLTAKPYVNLIRAASNISFMTFSNYQQTNLIKVLAAKHLLIDQEALPALETWLISTKKTAAKVEKTVEEVAAPVKKVVKK